jgi:hypothetical protein
MTGTRSEASAGVGYSGTPLANKLGYKPGLHAHWIGAPEALPTWLAPLPEGVVFDAQVGAGTALVHGFFTEARVLQATLQRLLPVLAPGAMFWVSWPKKASKVATDITEDTIRALALPLGLVDVKVCAVSEVWSGLKLVWRKERR